MWSSTIASYHFYLYDEAENVKLWEYPRTTPQDNQLRANNLCEDGLPAVNASIPQGDYYVAFGGTDCALHHVNLSTALLSGCGRTDLVPCNVGTDCADCGRSATAAAAATRRRRAQALPEIQDAHEMHHLNRTLAAASSWHLPTPWLQALRIKDHLL